MRPSRARLGQGAWGRGRDPSWSSPRQLPVACPGPVSCPRTPGRRLSRCPRALRGSPTHTPRGDPRLCLGADRCAAARAPQVSPGPATAPCWPAVSRAPLVDLPREGLGAARVPGFQQGLPPAGAGGASEPPTRAQLSPAPWSTPTLRAPLSCGLFPPLEPFCVCVFFPCLGLGSPHPVLPSTLTGRSVRPAPPLQHRPRGLPRGGGSLADSVSRALDLKSGFHA